MIGKNTKRKRVRYPHDSNLVIGEGSDMQFNPRTYKQWQEDACDADMWKHGRTSDEYRDGYDQIKWDK